MASTTQQNGNAYTISEKPIGEPRHLRVITIGAGASGLNLAHQIDKHMSNVDHVIYEKNSDVGGTWFENRYPGCACDIPSHNYQFTWEPSPEWTRYYSGASEYLEYFRNVARKYGLYRFIKLSHKVVATRWDEDEGIWNVNVENTSSGEIVHDWCHFMITGSGILNDWKWPDIPGLHTFKGQLIHSAAWDEDADWKGKTVAVLGCGSSGIQIVPTIQPEVKQLVTFIRSPTWITAGFAQSKAGPNGSNFTFTDEQKEKFRTEPDEHLQYRKEIEAELNVRFKFIIKDSPAQAAAVSYSTNEMKSKLGENSPLLKHLVPTFSVGCRRPTPGNGYLEALTRDNVRVVTDPITKIVPEGIQLETGEVIKVDMFICATGFDVSFRPRYPVIGRNGISLGDLWKEIPTAYLSLAIPNFPNHFMFLGPNAPIAQGSVLPIIEHAAKYIIRMLHKCQTQDIKTVAATQTATDDFTEHIRTFMPRTAWSTHCSSVFKNGKIDGPVIAVHPGSRVHWFTMLEEPRYEDYEWRGFKRNRFSYLGNGFSVREAEGRDSTYYFDNPYAGYENIRY
ncbi:hypothetical protein F4779DRAFT_611516 [Xylariaceae sp. FL0662B]|nr:hypothetical protein F4779DRAFT_611516 [Xylariaceae sp. FL0662B]